MPQDDVHPTLRLGEIVLRTSRYDAMKLWYARVLQIQPYFEHTVGGVLPSSPLADAKSTRPARLCFFRLVFEHPYQQVLALFDFPGPPDWADGWRCGLHHMQLRDASRAHMVLRCTRLAGEGIVPERASDHGPTTSCYYRDPDGNVVELAASNHVDVAKYVAARGSQEFQRNPFGRPLAADWFLSEAPG